MVYFFGYSPGGNISGKFGWVRGGGVALSMLLNTIFLILNPKGLGVGIFNFPLPSSTPALLQLYKLMFAKKLSIGFSICLADFVICWASAREFHLNQITSIIQFQIITHLAVRKLH